MEFNTPNGKMKLDPNSSISFIDSNGAYWSYIVNQVEPIQGESSDSNGALNGISQRLMSTNEDYIKTLKSLIINKGDTV